MTINESRNEFIKIMEKQINERINQDYNTFYIQQYDVDDRLRYGVIFNGHQVTLCKNLQALDNVIETLVFMLDGGHTTN